MAGNVLEWCWNRDYSYSTNLENNPHSPDTGIYRMLRGGCWYNYAEDCRVSTRFNDYPISSVGKNLGFRVVLPDPFPEFVGIYEPLTATTQPVYSDCLIKEDGKNSLIVVTHGWRPDVSWLRNMTNSITHYLTANGLNNWQVVGYELVEKASVGIYSVLNDSILDTAETEGKNLGTCLARDRWSHI